MTITSAGNVGIGTASPAASALLDVSSTSKGFLAPRMTSAQRNAITSPATGLMVFNTDNAAYEYYSGTAWSAIGGAGGGATTLVALSDVNVSSPSNGQVLTYNSTSGKWENLAGGGGVSADSLDFTEFKDAMALDASTDIALDGTEVLSVTNAGTGLSLRVNDDGTTTDTTPFVIDAAGNVGIGTSAPNAAYILDIQGSGLVQERIASSNSQAAYVLNGTFGQLYNLAGDLYITNNAAANIIFRRSASTETMRIASTGNVGIGTTSPTNLLSLGGDAARTIGMENSTTAAAAGNSLTLQAGGTKSGNTDQNGGDLILQSGAATGTGSSNITFKTNPAGTTGTTPTTPATAMTILGNGNVGIGTTNPGYKLDVSGTLNASGNVSANNLAVTSTNWIGWGNYSTRLTGANSGPMQLFTSSTERMRIDPSGNVGIGTTSPSKKLTVAGDVEATAYFNNSDRRLKDRIEGLEGRGLELVRKLRGVSFVWKSTGRQAMGFIAQEVEAVVPYAVSTDQQGYKSVDYVMLIAPVLEAVKQLDAEASARDKTIAELRDRIDHIEAVLGRLEAENARLRDELRSARTTH